jgi:hypothetical protein
MCAMSGKPRCDAAQSVIHIAGEAKLFQSAGHFARFCNNGAARRTLAIVAEP